MRVLSLKSLDFRFIFYFSLTLYFLSWFNRTFPWSLTNIPYFTVFSFERRPFCYDYY